MLNPQLIGSVIIDWEKIGRGSYLRDIPAISETDQITFTRPVTFFVGENGSGKSTLLEAIAIAYGFNPEGGTRNYSFSTYDSHSELCSAVRLSRGASKAAEYDAQNPYGPSFGDRDLHDQSHGESFLSFFQTFSDAGLYLMDEPEAALSPQRQLTLLLEIDRCVKEGSQFIIVTHSPILLALPGAEILSFDDGPVHPCSYEDTDSYQVMSMFINNREQILHRLLGG